MIVFQYLGPNHIIWAGSRLIWILTWPPNCTYLANIWYISSFTKFGPHFSRLFPVACMNMRFSAFLIREEFYMCPAEKNDLIKPLKPYLYLHNNTNFIHFIYVSNLWIYCCLFPRISFSCEYLVCLLSAYTSWINAMIIL